MWKGDHLLRVLEGDRFFWDVEGRSLIEGFGGRSLFGCGGAIAVYRMWEMRSFFGDVEGDRFLGCGSAIVFRECDGGRSFFGMWRGDRFLGDVMNGRSLFWDVEVRSLFGDVECDLF
jgi:hypothetical protein